METEGHEVKELKGHDNQMHSGKTAMCKTSLSQLRNLNVDY